MAAIVGTTGSIDLSAAGASAASIVEARVRRWSGTLTRTSNDSTPFAPTVNARTKVGGTLHFEGECEGFLDDTIPFAATNFNDSTSVAGTFVLVASNAAGANNTMTYSFPGHLIGFSPRSERGVLNTFTARFVATGAVTISAV